MTLFTHFRMTFIIMLSFVLSVGSIQAQTDILFVNDNAVNPDNTTLILSTFDDLGIGYTLFDAAENQASPTFDEMMGYDLVVWYTSTDGVGLQLWNGTETDNEALIAYLNAGGNLWLMGNDFLYDRYAAPYTFSSGDFVYDYLGTAQYYAQSYGDDGNLGVAQLDLEPNQIVSTLNPIQWTFSTAWWIDACLPVFEAKPIYRMGPEDYVFHNYFSGIYFPDPSEVFHTVSFFFDPALMDTDENRALLFSDVISFFNGIIFDGTSEDNGTDLQNSTIYPNPASDILHISTHSPAIQIAVYDETGKLVLEKNSTSQFETLNTSSWMRGVYYISVKTAEGISIEKAVKL